MISRMKIAFVTGSGRGLGKGFVDVLVTKGYFVYAGVRDASKFSNNEHVTYISVDVSNDENIAQAKDQITKEQGKLHLLINNAGLNKDSATGGQIEKVTKLNSLDRALLQEMFAINTVSPLMIIKSMVSLMTEPESFIINISSNRASFSDTTNTVANYGYRASKVALNMITQALLYDLPQNVSTFAVHPGFVKTDMNPQGILPPAEAAAQILSITEAWNPERNGKYLNNDGSLFPL